MGEQNSLFMYWIMKRVGEKRIFSPLGTKPTLPPFIYADLVPKQLGGGRGVLEFSIIALFDCPVDKWPGAGPGMTCWKLHPVHVQYPPGGGVLVKRLRSK